MSKNVKRGRSGLTQSFVENAPVGRHPDANGLSLIVKKEGQGSWQWRGQRNGLRREFGLGSVKDVKLAKARDMAAKMRAAMADGTDPLSAIGRGKSTSDKDWALNAVIERTFESLQHTLKDGGKAGNWMSPLRHHILPKLGKMSVEDIGRDDIVETLRPIWTDKHSTAKKAFNRLKAALLFADDEGADVDVAAIERAKRALKPVPDKSKRIPHTPYKDIPALYASICELDQTPATLALRLLLLTSHRSGPIRNARLDQFDLNEGTWTIPAEAMKGREGATVETRCPLCPEALHVVQMAMKHARSGNLFPAARGSGVVSDVGVTKVLNRIGETGRVHGLRSSFADWATAENVQYDLVERCLQHTIGNKVAQAYRRDDQLPQRRKVMDAWGEFATQALASTEDARPKAER